VLLLDEPTAGMAAEQVPELISLIQDIQKAGNKTVLLVEHNMNVIAGICDRISVLQRGAVLAEGTYEQVSKNPQVMEAYMGTTAGALEGAH